MGASFDDALICLYRAHAKALVEMAWVYVGDRADAEDVCLDTFIRLRRTWDAIDATGDVDGYLQATSFKIARSALRSTLIAWRYRPAIEPYVPVEEDLGFTEDQIALLAAVRRLRAQQRNAVLLHYWRGTAEMVHLERAMRSLGTPNVDARLRELADATHARVSPSADLLARIEAATINDRRQPFPAARLAGVAAAAVLVLVLVLAAPLLAGDVSHQPMTRMQLIVQVDHACEVSGAAFTQTGLVFPTPDGNKAVATALLGATQRLLNAAYAANPPADARAVLSNVDTELRSALAALQTVLAAVDAGDLTKARDALNRFRELTRAAASDLAAYGAQHCVLRS